MLLPLSEHFFTGKCCHFQTDRMMHTDSLCCLCRAG
ncbi:Uncharacterised protein [Vibrio cholerae]|nr:Uncharacterised protein [Vibrio cholerae]